MAATEHWRNEPDDHDYPAARDYLSLMFPDATSELLAHALESAPLMHREAKDLLRASGLAALPDTNVHVAADLKKVKKGGQLSPAAVPAITWMRTLIYPAAWSTSRPPERKHSR